MLCALASSPQRFSMARASCRVHKVARLLILSPSAVSR
jgi:predicted transcriptional regulator